MLIIFTISRHEYDAETCGIVVGLSKAGNSQREIVKDTEIPRGSVRHILGRYETNGTTANSKRTGRPSPINSRARRHILHDIDENPNLPWCEYGKDIGIGRDGIIKVAHEAGLFKRIKRRKPFLTAEHQQKRLKWAEDNQDQVWGRVLLSRGLSWLRPIALNTPD